MAAASRKGLLLATVLLQGSHVELEAFTMVPAVSSYCPSSCSTSTLWRQPSKWDLILDDEDDDSSSSINDDDDDGKFEYTPSPPDMIYEERNVKRAHQTFLAIRGAAGKELTNDVYVRDPGTEIFWYTGKVARVSDVSLEDCIARQWPMIERHAANLRPLELYPKRGVLEIWSAPGDSEIDVAYNRPSLQMVQHTKRIYSRNTDDYPKHVKSIMVGFQGEVYQENEDGFRTWRTDDGLPARPEINPGGETRPPTEEEYAQIQKELQTRDINDIYEEQERRKKAGGEQ